VATVQAAAETHRVVARPGPPQYRITLAGTDRRGGVAAEVPLDGQVSPDPDDRVLRAGAARSAGAE